MTAWANLIAGLDFEIAIRTPSHQSPPAKNARYPSLLAISPSTEAKGRRFTYFLNGVPASGIARAKVAARKQHHLSQSRENAGFPRFHLDPCNISAGSTLPTVDGRTCVRLKQKNFNMEIVS